MIYQQAKFVKGCAQLSQLPIDEGIEVAFAGRSNAGKSSALNAITNRKGLARISKTPGRTREINIFELDETRRIVDLPGYGFAKVSAEIKRRWNQLLNNYCEQRQSLRGLVLLMDVRHPLKADDEMMLAWACNVQLPVHILLTKADKLSRSQQNTSLAKVKQQLQPFGNLVSVQLFSSPSKLGVDEARSLLDAWYGLKD